MTRKQRRLTMIGVARGARDRGGAGAERACAIPSCSSSPTDVVEKNLPPGTALPARRPGAAGHADARRQLAVPSTSPTATHVPVTYQGILPDLFREGQGVVAEGALDADGVFKADTVLAKHDETYMPKEVADALKKQGHWKDDYGASRTSDAGSLQGTSK